MASIKLIAGVISLSLIFLLIVAGPAQAFVVGLTIENNSPILGDLIKFEVSSEIEQGETTDIQKFSLVLEGPQNLACDFSPDGTKISSCEGISIQQIETTDYQYGYGFLPGFLKYKIQLDSQTLQTGDYTAKLIAATPTSTYETSQQEIKILPVQNVNRCSIRAKEGTIQIDNLEFTGTNRLSFYFVENSANPQGTLTAQTDNRISYKFKVLNAQPLPDGTIQFDIKGELLLNRQPREESATIIYNPQTSNIKIQGTTLNAQDLNVNFAVC